MNGQPLLAELIGVANGLGVEVRTRALGVRHSRGGLCRLRGRLVVLLDSASPPVERARALAEALAGFDVGGLRISQHALIVLADARARSEWRSDERRPHATAQPRVRALARPKPGLRRCKPTLP